MANTNTAAEAMARIQVMHDLAPEMAAAFLSGLEAGYNLGKARAEEPQK